MRIKGARFYFILLLDNQAEISFKPSQNPATQIQQQAWSSRQSTKTITTQANKRMTLYNSNTNTPESLNLLDRALNKKFQQGVRFMWYFTGAISLI